MNISLVKFIKALETKESWTVAEIKGAIFDISMGSGSLGQSESEPQKRRPRGYAEPIDYSKPSQAKPVSDVPE